MPKPKKAAACEAIEGRFDRLYVGNTRIDSAFLDSLTTLSAEVTEAVTQIETIQAELESSLTFINALKQSLFVANSSGVEVSETGST